MENIKKALKGCDYPDWSFKRVQEQRKRKKQEKERKKKEQGKTLKKTRGNISLP